ncbi:hypothetical protein M2272_005142 [Mycobacterium frederiksbergense]|uniref:PepSY domain-containing protein n=1 Tax=Mycolicibacterium frederiksbergense TaxID=117567 RepID=A0ABT6L6F6_9MYCO|nr:hypothetical protein [Mycolicibacterium frederiksbergense]MDH6198483.1 hypothetical protein [Mycolicibacterium frederiksbergense]
MLSFDDARAVADRELRAQYPDGDFVVAEYGWETADEFVVVADAVSEAILGAPLRLVDKRTGELREIYAVPDRNAYLTRRDLAPIGPVPAAEARR